MVMPKKEPMRKPCQHCGKEMVQPRWSNGKLDSTFNARKFCSSKCAGWRETSKKSAGRKRAQRAVVMSACNRCPSVTDLQRHHIDRNPLNNNPENIEVLCQACHTKEHIKDRTWGRGQKSPTLPGLPQE